MLDRTSNVPLWRQISEQIAYAIRSRELAAGELLPSTRTLSSLLRVSRNTILAAYDDLAAEDLIEGRQGAGTRVQHRSGRKLPGSQRILREGRYPERIILFEDHDGNSLFLNF